MAIFKPIPDQSQTFNSVYNITTDASGWDAVTFQIVAPIAGSMFLYGSLDSGALQGVRQGDASLATNFTPIQATNLATGTAVTAISAAGNYKVTVGTQFIRLQGATAAAGTSVYRLFQLNQKID